MLTSPPHLHDWQQLDDRRHGCSGCETVVLACLHCSRPIETTALTVCDRCLDRGRRLVLDVVEDLDRFPYTHLEVMGLRSPRMDVARVTHSDDDARLPFGMDRQIEDVEALARWGGVVSSRAPSTALDVLRSWAGAWADVLSEDVPSAWESYLVERTPWAMQAPNLSGWREYEREARAVRSTVRRLLGIAPVREGTPCPSCGGRAVREWRPRADATPHTESAPVRRRLGTRVEGLDDVVRCSRCQRSWPTDERLNEEALLALPSLARRHPWATLTVGPRVQALDGRVGRQTIATWIHRGWLRPVAGPWPRSETRARRRPDGTTERLYLLADADKLAAWTCAEAEDAARTGIGASKVALRASSVASSS